MLERFALFLFPLLVSACYSHVEVSPTTLELTAGSTTTIMASRVPGGPGVPAAAVSNFDFRGTGAVAASGRLPANASSAAIAVQALYPGTGYVVSGISDTTYATVHVLDCLTPPELTPQISAIVAKPGQQVFLRVEPSIPGGTFQWYTGPLADASHPIPFSNTPYYIDFTPRANGSYPFWVRYTTACGAADAAFVVNAGAQHRRAAGR